MLKFAIVLFVSILSIACGTHFNTVKKHKSIDSVYILTKSTDSTEKFTLLFNSTVVLEREHEDGSSLYFLFDYKDTLHDYKCFVMNNNSADCNQFIFFNKKTAMFYVTEKCFSFFYPEPKSLDFRNLEINLYNKNAEEVIEYMDSKNHASHQFSNKWIVGKLQDLRDQKSPIY